MYPNKVTHLLDVSALTALGELTVSALTNVIDLCVLLGPSFWHDTSVGWLTQGKPSFWQWVGGARVNYLADMSEAS